MDGPAGVYRTANTVRSASAGRVSVPFWEDTIVPTHGLEDPASCYQMTILQPISYFSVSPTSRLFEKQRKQNHTQSYHHLAASDQQARDFGSQGSGSHKDQYSPLLVAVEKQSENGNRETQKHGHAHTMKTRIRVNTF
jgi:hypothetical protein